MKKYYCSDCGIELDEGEGSVFTCCEPCWDKHYKKTDEQSEVSVEAKVILICPDCGGKAELKDSAIIYGKSYGLVYVCENYPE